MPHEPSAAAQALAEFHEHPNTIGTSTNDPALRLTLHHEEHRELEVELAAGGKPPWWKRLRRSPQFDRRKVARELADVVYVSYGTAYVWDIDLDAALAEIHRAAMDKVRAGLKRADGKIIKPPGFRPPDMTAAITVPAERSPGQRVNAALTLEEAVALATILQAAQGNLQVRRGDEGAYEFGQADRVATHDRADIRDGSLVVSLPPSGDLEFWPISALMQETREGRFLVVGEHSSETPDG